MMLLNILRKYQIVLWLFMAVSCFAQNASLNSLKNDQLFFLKKKLLNALELENTELEINLLLQISEIYLHENNYEMAEEYSSMALNESHNNAPWMLDKILLRQAETEYRKGNYQRSVELSKEALAHTQEKGDTQMETACLCNITDCLIQMKQYREARTVLEKCLSMKHLDDSFDDYKSLRLMAELEYESGNFVIAFRRLREWEQLMNKKYLMEQMQIVSDMALHEEMQKLETKLSHIQSTLSEQKNKTTQTNTIIVVLFLMMCGEIFFFFLFRKSFRNLKPENVQITNELTLIINKKNKMTSKQRLLLQKKESLQQTNDRLVASNRSKTELFKTISHDLQMPLFRLQQNLIDLMLTDIGEDQFKQAATELTNMVGNISLLLENLLQWSKYQSQGIHATPQNYEMTALIREFFSQQRNIFTEKKITFSNAVAQKIFMCVDKDMMIVLLKIIMQNIVKLSEPDATITISGDQDGKNGWLQVNYTGQMPLKQSFIQQSQTVDYGSETTELGKAISLGWMLSRTLMKANDGNICVEDLSTESLNIILYFNNVYTVS